MEGQGTVRVFLSQQEEVAKVEVHDEGPGLDRETAEQLFDPFFSTKPRGQGTGMGLPVSQRLIEEAGGRLWLASEPGSSGCVFAFELPLARIHAET